MGRSFLFGADSGRWHSGWWKFCPPFSIPPGAHMPVPPSIAQAAEDYRFNNNFLLSSVKDLSADEWLKRPNECTNHIAWIVGHLIWARKAVLGRLGAEWSTPWLGQFARGAKLDDTAAYPSSDALIDAWKEVS